MTVYSGRCAITDCEIDDVLEAAHISPYSGRSSDQVCNGLLLRADVHTLFDCGLLAFDL
jgi:putative restriction endonuclease